MVEDRVIQVETDPNVDFVAPSRDDLHHHHQGRSRLSLHDEDFRPRFNETKDVDHAKVDDDNDDIRAGLIAVVGDDESIRNEQRGTGMTRPDQSLLPRFPLTAAHELGGVDEKDSSWWPCKSWKLNTSCSDGERCPLLHASDSGLDVRVDRAERMREQMASLSHLRDPNWVQDFRICSFFVAGQCMEGMGCRDAHPVPLRTRNHAVDMRSRVMEAKVPSRSRRGSRLEESEDDSPLIIVDDEDETETESRGFYVDRGKRRAMKRGPAGRGRRRIRPDPSHRPRVVEDRLSRTERQTMESLPERGLMPVFDPRHQLPAVDHLRRNHILAMDTSFCSFECQVCGWRTQRGDHETAVNAAFHHLQDEYHTQRATRSGYGPREGRRSSRHVTSDDIDGWMDCIVRREGSDGLFECRSCRTVILGYDAARYHSLRHRQGSREEEARWKGTADQFLKSSRTTLQAVLRQLELELDSGLQIQERARDLQDVLSPDMESSVNGLGKAIDALANLRNMVASYVLDEGE